MDIVDVSGYIFALLLFAKVIMHGYLDYVYGKSVTDFVPTFFPMEYFLLPYDKDVNNEYTFVKKVCNFCYYAFISSGLIFLFLILFT